MNTPRTSAGAAGLLARLMETVRPEFRAEVFCPPRDSPVFFPGECRIPSCPTTLTMGRLKLCRTHHHRWAAAGCPVDLDGWSAQEDARLHQRRQVSACLVAGCNRARAAHALCHRHASRWTHAGRPSLGTWLGRTLYQPPRKPWSAERTCEFPDCPRWTDSTDAPLCHTHHNRWRKHGRPALDTWYDDLAHRGDPKIRLEQLGPALRLEFQFGLQHRHDEGLRFTPARDVRRAVTWAREAPTTSLLDWDESTWRDHAAPLGLGRNRHGHNVVAFRFIADTRFALEHLLIADDPWAAQYPREMWDLRHFALAEGETRYLRFGGISQPWLRELVKRWCRWRISTNISVNTVAGNLRSLHHLSRHLSPNAAPADLTRARIETWLAALAVDYPDVFTRRATINSLGRFLADARAHDWQPVLPRDAIIYNDAPPPPPAKPRWISEHLMRQMENPANLALISSDDLRLMVPLLISCGLRMKDARRLKFDCITHDDTGAPYLTWVNHKIHGRIAFFPISQALADKVAAQQKRVQARFPAGSRFLFPGWTANLNGSKAVSDTWCRKQMETWLERIRLIDEHGRPARVTFHQFRHTLGTRLINANVPQHIVQQLLDHMSPQMTAIYARLHQKTLREHWEKSLKVNAEGEAVALPVDHPLADATWMRLSLVRAKVSLPNGYCGAPIQTDCEYANPCLDCRFFITTGDFLDQHRRQREETRKLIGDAEQAGLSRIVEKNTRTLGKLDTIIDALEQAGPQQIVAGGKVTDLDATG
ncbi:tyrosine-type recombinase/integrase [Streptomyces sp. NBC_00264]|uniref:tyrosine-type recombinase/integrase n=1 Tax=unclassified Streptomyces TaxID=2593676 RepID=UPI002252D19E|nr:MULTISPECIES: tyrosine-type recombinase/integrase [unclassified Streptomyces]MCX5163726.1 tyrosine-type recombinase/integrase [Streptomyces sp. NBC_00305]MCX5222249.1 tyrosine-type recombinase/integrase [Streptomyces sp. NBC_00264]WSC32203.1 tyrosine-type recombinase/integrase [Streptomyces sp. NBC_01768]